MTNADLKNIICEIVPDEDEQNEIIVLEGDEFADGAVGLSNRNQIIYDYNLLVESLMKHKNWNEQEAIDWLEYNPLGSLPYMSTQGKEPIIIINRFEDYV